MKDATNRVLVVDTNYQLMTPAMLRPTSAIRPL